MIIFSANGSVDSPGASETTPTTTEESTTGSSTRKTSVTTITTPTTTGRPKDSKCKDGWIAFQEESCVKIFEAISFENYADNDKKCHDQNSSLMEIHYKGEQDFILYQNLSANIWLGIKYDDNEKAYKWNDGSKLVYENWVGGGPKKDSKLCVQLFLEEQDNPWYGKWSEVSCSKKNLVVCQKPQDWSLSRLQKALVNTMRNPVPIGFVFVQLPDQKPPQDLWPWMTWKNISSKYAGVFFRVEGEQSSEFGMVQDENAPRVTNINTVTHDKSDPGWEEAKTHLTNGFNNATIPVGNSSLWTYLGGSNGTARYVSLVTSDGEVRPKNMAIRVWIRVG